MDVVTRLNQVLKDHIRLQQLLAKRRNKHEVSKRKVRNLLKQVHNMKTKIQALEREIEDLKNGKN